MLTVLSKVFMNLMILESFIAGRGRREGREGLGLGSCQY